MSERGRGGEAEGEGKGEVGWFVGGRKQTG